MPQELKPQGLRLFDVFIRGPYLIYLSNKKKNMTKNERKILMVMGISIIGYEGFNYLTIAGKS